MYTRRRSVQLHALAVSLSQSLELLVKDRLSAKPFLFLFFFFSRVFHQHPTAVSRTRIEAFTRRWPSSYCKRDQSISKSIDICDLMIMYFQSDDILIFFSLFIFNPYIRRGDIYIIRESSIFLSFFFSLITSIKFFYLYLDK